MNKLDLPYPHSYLIAQTSVAVFVDFPLYVLGATIRQLSTFLTKGVPRLIASLAKLVPSKPHEYQLLNSEVAAQRLEEHLRTKDLPSSVKVLHFCRNVFCIKQS